MNHITLIDSGGASPNRYKIIFSGDQKPEKTQKHGSTINDSDSVYKNNRGNWTVQGHLNGGRDGWSYSGERIRHVLEFPDRMRFKINDAAPQPSRNFRVRERETWPGDKKQVRRDIPDEYDQIGERAGAYSTDRSDWDRVSIKSQSDFVRAVQRHGSRTVFELWSDVTIRRGTEIDRNHVAFVGRGTSQSTVHLRGRIGSVFQIGDNDNYVSDVHIRNLDVDVRRCTLNTAVIQAFTKNAGVYAKDVNVRGEISGKGDFLTVTTRAGAVFDGELLSAPDGAERTRRVDSTKDSIGAIHVGNSDGVLRLQSCEFGMFPNNGIYASGSAKHGNDGYAVIIDHVSHGSDRDGIRVGGPSLIVDPQIIIDESKAGHDNLRGLWFRYARGARVIGGMIKTHFSDGGPAIYCDSTAGEVFIEDMDIELRSSHKAARGLYAAKPTNRAGDNTTIHMSGTRIHGDGTPRDVVLVKGRRTNFKRNQYDVDGAEEDIDIR